MSRHHDHWKIIGKKEHRIYKVAAKGAAFLTAIQFVAWILWMIVVFLGVKGGPAFGAFLASAVMLVSVAFFYVGAAEILKDTDRTE